MLTSSPSRNAVDCFANSYDKECFWCLVFFFSLLLFLSILAFLHWADCSLVSSAQSMESLAGLYRSGSYMNPTRHTTKSVIFISKIQDFVNSGTSAEALLLLIVRTGRLLTIFYLCSCTRAYMHRKVVLG